MSRTRKVKRMSRTRKVKRISRKRKVKRMSRKKSRKKKGGAADIDEKTKLEQSIASLEKSIPETEQFIEGKKEQLSKWKTNLNDLNDSEKIRELTDVETRQIARYKRGIKKREEEIINFNVDLEAQKTSLSTQQSQYIAQYHR
jgi:hypothetical protein